MTEILPLSAGKDGCILNIHATPRACRDAIDGIEADAAGRVWLRVRTTAVPEDGKANRAVVKLLAKSWKIPASCFTVISGEAARYKRVRIDAPYQEIAECLKTP